jgi:hypothetical protein
MSTTTETGRAQPTGRKRGPKPKPRIYLCPQVCRMCGESKPPDAFERHKGGTLRRDCRVCRGEQRKAKMRERYHEDPAYRRFVLDRNRAYAETCRDYLNTYARRYYAEHRDKLCADAREYRRRKAAERASANSSG